MSIGNPFVNYYIADIVAGDKTRQLDVRCDRVCQNDKTVYAHTRRITEIN